MSALVDLTGRKFGRLTVVGFTGRDKNGYEKWSVLCDCGTPRTVYANNLKQKRTLSCGCLSRDHRHASAHNLQGQRFGKLVVLARTKTDKNRNIWWQCVCDCGKETALSTTALRNRHTRSCGCLAKTASRTHGMCTTKIYHIWGSLNTRCSNPNDADYSTYGGRGITVCDRWRESFENFFADMGGTYSEGLSIERNDVNGNYEPSNCKWIPFPEQFHNMRKTIRYAIGTKIGRWTVVSEPVWGVTSNGTGYHCQCECGTQSVIKAATLKYGYSKSCGCLMREMAKSRVQMARFAKIQKRVLAMFAHGSVLLGSA